MLTAGLGISLTLLLMGGLASLVTALGHRRWWWALGILLCHIIFAPLYCLTHRHEAAWPGSLLLKCGLAFFMTGILAYATIAMKLLY